MADHETPRPVRAALIGYGLGGAAFHAPLLARVPGLRLDVVVTSSAERGASVRQRYPDTDVLPEVDALWARGGVDLVVLSTPNRTHGPLARAALDAGADVVVDKPLAPTAAEARRLVEEARRRGRMLTVYQNRRWDGDFMTLRRLIGAGDLGDVLRLESRFERWREGPKTGWRQDPSPGAAGGLLFDLGAHLIDQALVLLGPVREVYAELDRRRPGARVDDDVFLALTHESGARSHLWMNVIAAEPAPRFRVLGSRATWTKWGMDPQEAALRSGGGPGDDGYGVEPEAGKGLLAAGDSVRMTPMKRGDWAAFYRGVVRSIREGAPPPVDPGDAVAVLDVIERARSIAG